MLAPSPGKIHWSRSWKFWTALTIYGALLGLFAVLFPLFVLFNSTSPYRPIVMMFLDENCGGQPTNKEAPGIALNRPDDRGWRIALYNGQCKHRLFFGLGGDDFREAASGLEFTHRINARNVEQATQSLARLLAEKPASVQEVEIVVLDHGSPGAPRFASRTIPESFYQAVKRGGPQRTTLRFFGCAVGQGEKGKAFMDHLAATYGFRVFASVERISWNTIRWIRSGVVQVPAEDWVMVEPN